MESDEKEPGLEKNYVQESQSYRNNLDKSNDINSTADEYKNQNDVETISEEDEDEVELIDESLGTTILNEIQQGSYVCLVCTGEIDQDSTIWTCAHCYRVYDLDCIKDWAINGSSTNKVNKSFRCPSCNTKIKKRPKKFTCWCGKISNPDKNPLMPFSCGNSCNYKYQNCIHKCSSICHPGKHPVCGALGPVMKCKCGEESRQLPCIITPYDKGWRCENECKNIKLCDLNHRCKKGCHDGFCGKCKEKLILPCYCGKNELKLQCCNKELKDCGGFIGGGSCKSINKIYYDCNEHYELKPCQPIKKIEKCKYSPDVITTCYCGKTKVDTQNRSKCTDPVPECDLKCNKLLPCGHHCQFKCHEGECECTTILDLKCSCGNESYSAKCKSIQQGFKAPKCNHKCSVLLSCRRHYHREPCCEYEQIGLERERIKKKQIRNNLRTSHNDLMSIEAIHICTKTCNRLKSCGLHECQAMCHNGPCEICLESTNDDLVCNCGKTIIHAPVRCGTKLICNEQCIRPKQCGHPTEHHKCHEFGSCPNCTALIKKTCNCGNKHDIPALCSQERVSCGKICQVAKDCGHPCLRTCSGECTKGNHNTSINCQSFCKKVRTTCPHLCKLKCHYNKKQCDEVICNENVQLSCECGNLQRKVKCGSSLIKPTTIGIVLPCDDSCAIAKRDAKLRAAFNVDDEKSEIYSLNVLETFQKQKNWCLKIERIVKQFVIDCNNGITKKTFHFHPMNSLQRQFIHELTDAYHIYTESQDQEPKRSVFMVITRLTKIPEKSIEQVINENLQKEIAQSKVEELSKEEIDNSSFNAILIKDLFFGIGKKDLERGLDMQGTFQWIKDSTFVYYTDNYKSMTKEFEDELYLLSKRFKKIIREKSLAFDCKLCLIDDSATYVLKTEHHTRTTPEVKDEIKTDNNAFSILSI
ncbi:unnamed protein product [Candida verbasci]|uniref:Uncharacterized protein n=1 Tax=Candida verbasci TaxID=1227364 RepID=A0A9W4TQ17_9ASCO|nr:unnamed protein product [Candida verbasci]